VYKNLHRLVLEAVRSFLESHPEGLLFLIDNSPQDTIRKYFISDQRVRYIFNNKNLGFGAAHNIALKQSLHLGAVYHLVLNPDVYFAKNVIPELLDQMDAHPDVGLLTPKVLYPDGRIQYVCRLLPSPENLFLRRFLPFYRKLFDRTNQSYEQKFSGYDKLMDVPCLYGCFMLLRNDCLQKVGLFDENIFLYVEDIDLTRRMHKYFRTVYYPGVSIYHVHERGSYKHLIPFLFHVKSAITYFNKWGWFRDPERDFINRATLIKLSS
jgi:GT2 family glycosyltransferase